MMIRMPVLPVLMALVLLGKFGISQACGQASFQGLGDLPGGIIRSHARGVSADGSVWSVLAL